MRLFLVFGWGLMMAAAAISASAAPFESGSDFRPPIQNQPPRPGPQREADKPAPPQRETRAPGDANSGRMSPDERRQLRRDIQDAGRDIYHRDRQGPRHEQRR